MNKTTNQQTTQQKTEPTNNKQKTHKPIRSNLVPCVTGFEGCSSRFVVSSVGRKVVGSEEFWRDFLLNLSFQDLARFGVLQKECMNKKFPSSNYKPNKSRNVFRVFTGQDLLDFFGAIKPNEVKFGLGFYLQLTCGFRIGEVPPIKEEKIDFRRGVISLKTEKANVFSDQPVPSVALDLLETWLKHNGGKIARKSNFVFFSENFLREREAVSKDSFRNYFQKIRKRSALCSTYAERDDTNNPLHKTNHHLHKLSSHSLRRTYLTALYQECRKTELVAVLARHKKKDVTSQYIYFSHEEQLELVNKTFNREPYLSIARDLREKIKFKGR